METETVVSYLVTVHVLTGFITLASGIVAFLAKSLNFSHKWHIYSGNLFSIGMLLIFISAILLTIIEENLFLFLIAIFSMYLTSLGWLYAKSRQGERKKYIEMLSKMMLFVSLIMISYGVFLIFEKGINGFALVAFGAIGSVLSLGDLRAQQQNKVIGKERIIQHLTMMLSGLIATMTAFAVTNFQFEPVIILWLLPTAVVSPIIFLWSRKIRMNRVVKGM